MTDISAPSAPARGTVWEAFRAFLLLGLTSFGGPIAHLGYFRTAFVERRKWLEDDEFADLVALCQFLPGPASSQVGFAVGLRRAGIGGALAAFVGFTLPSAILMLAFAAGASWFSGSIGAGILTGLKIVAVAIIAQAVWGMARSLAPDRQRAAIAALSAVAVLLVLSPVTQPGVIVLGALAGWLFCRTGDDSAATSVRFGISRTAGIACLTAFVVLLVGSPIAARLTGIEELDLFAAFYRAGALVFGGGHVVLPLLQTGIVDTGWVTPEQFLAGYGGAQAVPGPLFTVAAHLGAVSTTGPGSVAGAAIALAGIFPPGFLLLLGVLPFWDALRDRVWARSMMRGANAAVVGVLAAALYQPVFTTAVSGPASLALALVCFIALVAWKVPPWVVVILGAVGGPLIALL